MKKSILSIFFILIFGAIATGCTVHINGISKESNDVAIAKPVSIKVSIYKQYEDGVELKMQLDHVPNAKGTWTIRMCDQEEVQASKGPIVIYGIPDCITPDENDQSDDTMYINFTGSENGKKVTVDKVYVWDDKLLENIPLERQNPDSPWIMLQTFIRTGYLYGASVHIGSSKQDIIDFFGEPEKAENPDFFGYDDVEFLFSQNKVEQITMKSTKDNPIKTPNNDKDDIIRVFGNPIQTDGDGEFYDSVYELSDRRVTFTWSNKQSQLVRVNVEKK
ncbi:hypothetical protein [Shimazuella kribbensis]|uniref:hypothetical protein n=1 Tax=Shimazuella kribbensis TaxID=139808 RepID=UPI00041C6D21|nr:hypothetical protein [Shimazuella kribbensis]